MLRVGVWTAATAEYARKIVALLLGRHRVPKLAFLWTRVHCNRMGNGGGYWKDLRRIGKPGEVLIVDDNTDTISMNRAHGYPAVQVTRFWGARDKQWRPCLRASHPFARDDCLCATPVRNKRRQLPSLHLDTLAVARNLLPEADDFFFELLLPGFRVSLHARKLETKVLGCGLYLVRRPRSFYAHRCTRAHGTRPAPAVFE